MEFGPPRVTAIMVAMSDPSAVMATISESTKARGGRDALRPPESGPPDLDALRPETAFLANIPTMRKFPGTVAGLRSDS